MSMGGNFYALSDELLTKMECASDGKPNEEGRVEDFYEDCLIPFLDGNFPNEPREVFSEQEWHWYALTLLLAPEDACGLHQELGGDAMGYSFSSDVIVIAAALSELTDDEIRERYDEEIEQMNDAPVEELIELIHGVTAFYQRAAANRHAVLFRVT